MRHGFKLIFLAVAVIALGGCTLPRGAALTGEVLKQHSSDKPTFAVVPVTQDNVRDIARWPATGWSGSYRWIKGGRGPQGSVIKSGDRLNLVIWDSEENSLLTTAGQKTVALEGIQVSPSGTIFVPYIDEISVSGLSPDKARLRIQERLEPSIPSAQVQVTVAPGRGNSVDMVAGVARPGTYPLPDRNSSILSLIAQAGGVSEALENPLVRLIRAGQEHEIRAQKLFSDSGANIALRGGDQVIVQEDDRYFTALGATGSERLVPFETETVNALEALSIIGGLNDVRANPRGVLILRDYPASALRTDGSGPEMEQTVFTFDLTHASGLFAARKFNIHPGDTVLATESPVTAARTVLELIGSAFGAARTASNTSG